VGLDRIAVTDHGEIDGALEAHALDPQRIIVGEEITARCGTDLIGLFLNERIPQQLSLVEIAERIADQGGVVYAPHPFAYISDRVSRAARAMAVAEVVEGINSRAFWPPWNRMAARAASRQGLPIAAGSDAHFPHEIGRAYTELPAFRTADELRAALGSATPVSASPGSPWIHFLSMGLRLARLAAGASPAAGSRQSPDAGAVTIGR
jgi:predicted metal-dependent phosphoesterase TrpH